MVSTAESSPVDGAGRSRSCAPSTLGLVLRQRNRHQQPARREEPATRAYINRPPDDNKTAYHRRRHLVQQQLRQMTDTWTARKTEDFQGTDCNTLFTEKTQILQRWAVHFRGVFNHPSTISDVTIFRLSQVEKNVDLYLLPSLHETIKAVQQFFCGKAPESDAIAVGVYKHGGPQPMDHLTEFFQEMWRHGKIPQYFKDATIVHLYKRKRNHQISYNYRGISQMNIVEKIFTRILLNCLNNHLEQGLLPESQCGFRHHRETMEIIFGADDFRRSARRCGTTCTLPPWI
nr:unnamed protein product [Spirometra erinaceieuropaei]